MTQVKGQALTAGVLTTIAYFIFGWLAPVGVGLSVNAFRQAKAAGESTVLPIVALVYSSIMTVMYLFVLF